MSIKIYYIAYKISFVAYILIIIQLFIADILYII